MHTHTFEIAVNGISINGEMNFNSGNVPGVKFNSAFEMEMKEFDSMNEFLKQLQKICKCGEIKKIEILKK